MNATNLFHADGKPSKVWFCSACRMTGADQDAAERCCRPNVCACGAEIDERYYATCKACREKVSEGRELAKFQAAEKVENYDGPVYSDGLGWNEGYFSNLEEMMDEIPPEEWPEYVWTCDVTPTVSLSFGNLIDNIEFPENQDEHDLDGVKELEEALEAFNKKNENMTSWNPNYKACVTSPGGFKRMKNTMYMRNNDGVHYMSVVNSEFSLCGDAFDIGSENGMTNMEQCESQKVTCPRCREAIDDILKEFKQNRRK